MRWHMLVSAVLLGLGLTLASAAAVPTATVSGVVRDENGQPVAGATVRVQATTNATTSAADGSFSLSGLPVGTPVTISAWKHLYYCGIANSVVPPASGVTFDLRLYQTTDNPDYEWIPPISSSPGVVSCATCKSGVTQIFLDNDAHGKSAVNPRFLSMYKGTDTTGRPSVAPGYKLDFPNTAGACANCHAPGAAVDAPFNTDMNTVTGVDKDFGVHCDFCHKVANVYLDPATGLPYPNVPGVMSMDVRRPFPESSRYQIFFGTFDDDNVPLEDTKLPLIGKSQWCAACHQFSFWGTPIYQSFKEWLDSSYPARGVECQTCHMPPDGVMTNVAPGMGGVERDPRTIHAHTMPGAASVPLLENTVSMTMRSERVGNVLRVTVVMTNTGAGHDVPTDFPGRHMILTVKATDAQGKLLSQTKGPTVPVWGGDRAGQPGKAFAKVLRDLNSGEEPTAAYWNPTVLVSDNRLSAFEIDTSVYEFSIAGSGTVNMEAKLIFRRAFQGLMTAKRWDKPDIVMERATAAVVLQ